MKKIIFALMSIMISISSKAQWNDNGATISTSDDVHVAGDVFLNGGNNKFVAKRTGFDMELEISHPSSYALFETDNNYNSTKHGYIFRSSGTTGSIDMLTLDQNTGNAKFLGDVFLSGGNNKFVAKRTGFDMEVEISHPSDYALFETDNNYNSTKHGFIFRAASTVGSIDMLTLDNNTGDANFIGKVGIGTSTTGSHKLAVEGSIGAREIKVEAFPNWSDFVFEKSYELPTLVDVEKHIKKNGHLKDIPSAEEVKENGIYLGQMDSKLLQKIEELTLYMIEMNKRMNQLEEENQQLKAKISN